MKAIDNWLLNGKRKTLITVGKNRLREIKIAREAWKAALNEILTNGEWGYDEVDEYDRDTGIRCIWINDIRKELEND